ncbi:MAG TPA: thrombospondin type 3 repeat-containing protein, partial [Myxococcota bacterium]|nr:thrombospondin type 3 repeat-containing protein [Myxococcota bacterium]
NGDVVLVDGGAFLFKRFTRGGAFERSWGFSYRVDITRAGGVGQGNHTAVAVAPDGSVWTGIVGTYYSDNPPVPWITHFDPSGAVIGAAKRKPVAGNYGEIIADVAVEPGSRDLFVSDQSFNHLRRVNALGIPVKELALPLPGGLSFAGGKLYVVSAQGETVKRFDGTLALEETFGSPGTGDGQFDFDPQSGIAARASDGHFFVADTRNNRVQELGADGSFMAKRGSYGSDPGQFALPEDVALSPAGDVLYVANTYDHRIDMFCLSADAACNAIVDQDGDGLADFQDNCPFEKNPRQRDGGSFASKVPDGIGDACQCGDLSGDGIVDAADVAAYRKFLTRNPFDPSAAARKCKVAPDGGPCSILDVVVLERALDPRHLLGPQVNQVCEAATKVAP